MKMMSEKSLEVLFLLFSLLLLLQSCSSSRIQLDDNGGYHGLTIKIREDVPSDKCSEILSNLQNTIREASGILFDALSDDSDRRVFLKRVTVVVPSGWTDSTCKVALQVPRYPSNYGAPDVYVSPDGDPIYGNHPRTIHSKGCGLPGDFIEFPFSLLNDTRTAARSLVSEWVKYRYGVFEEHGFPGDTYYPVYYERNGSALPAGNTDGRLLSGEWKNGCDPRTDPKCYFTYSDASEVNCSMGFVPFLSNVSGFCTQNQDFQAVQNTKQFTLCQGKTSHQIIHEHRDFQSFSRLFRHPHPKPTLVSFVREPPKKYLLFVEASSIVARSGLWKWISKATQNLIRYDLPTGAEISILTYSNETYEVAKSIVLSSERIRGQLADKMPSKQQVKASSEASYVSVAFDTIVNNKLGMDPSGTKIVLIKRDSDKDGLNRKWEQELINYTLKNQVEISTILFRDSSRGSLQPSPFYDSLSALSGGKTFVYDLQVRMSLYFNIMSSLKDIIMLDPLNRRVTPHIIHSDVSKGLRPLESSFTVDAFLGRETTFGILVNETENHKVRSVTFWDESGNTYGPYQSMSSQYNGINMKTINFLKITNKPPFDDDSYLGKPWKYRVEWFSENSHNAEENVVVVTSKPREGGEQKGGLSIQVWTSAESSDDKATDLHPLSIYVRITHGFNPVLNAKVMAKASIIPDIVESSTIIESKEFELLDNGNGDPDIIKNDGIYSRYVTEYHGTGRYQFSIYVENPSDETAFTLESSSAAEYPSPSKTTPICCGSLVHIEEEAKVFIGSFFRTVSGPVVHLLEVPSAEEDKMPPNRVLDLKIFHIQGEDVTAEWTAPGDDFDSGAVASYHFVLMDRRNFTVRETLHELQRSDPSGSRVSTSFKFPIKGTLTAVGLIPFDEAGNEGNVSNVVSVYVPSDPVTVTPTPPGPLVKGDSNWVTIGIVLGILATLLLLFLILVIYFSRRRRRHDPNGGGVKSSGVNVDLHHSSDSSSYESDIKNLSSNQLVPPPISTITNAYKNSSGSNKQTSFGQGLTPTYWSASQLLREHEERHSSKPPPPHVQTFMGSIAEEEGYYNRALEDGGDRYYSSTISPPYDEGVIVEDELIIAGVPKGSNSSSSTLGVLVAKKHPPGSVHGSTLSVNNNTKTRNITQV